MLLRRRDLGLGAFTVLGDPYEEYSILILTGTCDTTFEEFRKQINSPVILYKPQVSQLLRRFHSLIVMGFGTSRPEP